MSKITYDSIKVGDSITPFTAEPLTRNHLVRYAGASGDFNPLHHDETFVQKFGMPRVISHGMLVMGIVGRAITVDMTAFWRPTLENSVVMLRQRTARVASR